MIFENIKVGDVVYTPHYINTDHCTCRQILLRRKISVKRIVVKVTNTQFVTTGNFRFNKKNGRCIGSQDVFFASRHDSEFGMKDQWPELQRYEKYADIFWLHVQHVYKLCHSCYGGGGDKFTLFDIYLKKAMN